MPAVLELVSAPNAFELKAKPFEQSDAPRVTDIHLGTDPVKMHCLVGMPQ